MEVQKLFTESKNLNPVLSTVVSKLARTVCNNVAKCIGNPILKKMCHVFHGNLFFEPLDDQIDLQFGQCLQIVDIHAI